MLGVRKVVRTSQDSDSFIRGLPGQVTATKMLIIRIHIIEMQRSMAGILLFESLCGGVFVMLEAFQSIDLTRRQPFFLPGPAIS